MIDCNKDIKDYHDEKVKLTDSQIDDLKEKRRINRDRVERGLEASEEPAPTGFVTQGSFAMGTIIQEEPDRTYDLDEGIIFTRDSLVGSGGADKTALDARKMVQDAVDDGSFGTPPEVKTNCVRIVYSDGLQVDMPVYRRETEEAQAVMELASGDWKESDPQGVTDWFQAARETQPFLRQLVRLFKSFCKNRPSYPLPSGFVLTVLAHECYRGESDRLDENLRRTIEEVHARLTVKLTVRHPVVDEWLIADVVDSRTAKLRDLLDTAVEDFQELDLPNCTRSRALKVWKKVFHTDYFDSVIKEAEGKEKEKTAGVVAALGSSRPKPWSCGDLPRTYRDGCSGSTSTGSSSRFTEACERTEPNAI